MKKIGIIGLGNMGEILVDACVSFVGRSNVYCFDIDEEKIKKIKKYKVNILNSNKDLVCKSNVIFIAVKPQDITEVLREISPYINKDKVLVSIAAGIKINLIEKVLKKYIGISNNKKVLKKFQIVRCMPNLPLKVSCGVVGICKNKFVKKRNFELIKKIFSLKGIVVEVSERYMNLITAISGSGPAYIFYISEIVQKIADKLGLPKKIVSYVVNYTILGAAKMLVETNIEASRLKESVISKGGTTEQALKVFYKNNLNNIFYRAIKKAFIRARQLSNIRFTRN